MRKAILTWTLLPCAAIFIVGAGCQNKASETPAASSDLTVTPVSTPTASATPTYTPAAAPVSTAQPVTYDTTPGAAPAGGIGGPTSGSPYVVKRGDTLYGIARRAYGDGKQWQKIAEANPGLSPQSLRIGQTINVP